jgi:hypothetical protein
MLQIPAVSRVAETWKTGRVLRLNTASEVNKRYAEQIGVTDTPTFVLLDPSGRELRRWTREVPAAAELP